MIDEYKQYKRAFELAKSRKANWNTIYQVIGEYIDLVKMNFTTTQAPGEFLLDRVFDSKGSFAASASSAAILGMVWPGTAEQAFKIDAPEEFNPNEEEKAFYERMGKMAYRRFDDPRAGLILAMDEAVSDLIKFGTVGLGVEKGDESSLLFKPYGVKELYIVEGKNGRVGSLFIEWQWQAERVVAEYGEDKVSPRVRKLVQDGKGDTLINIVLHICKRKEKRAARGKYAMPIASYHFELDNWHLIKEEGFNEPPISVSRFRKNNYEEYGRCGSFSALPEIIEANVLRESLIIATEKILDMPKGVLDDGAIGGGVVDFSAGSVSVFNATGNIGGNQPVFEIGTPPNIPWALERLKDIEESIAQHYYIDRLLDFNNDVQMTLGETQIRDQKSNASMSSIYNRIYAELITPTVERGIAILWRDGEFGVVKGSAEEAEELLKGRTPYYVPDRVAELLARGEDIYRIVYNTKAASAAKSQEYMAILELRNFVMESAQVDPSIVKRFDFHSALKDLAALRGSVGKYIRSDEAVNAMMEQEAKLQEAQMALQAGESMANIADKAASAESRSQ